MGIYCNGEKIPLGWGEKIFIFLGEYIEWVGCIWGCVYGGWCEASDVEGFIGVGG